METVGLIIFAALFVLAGVNHIRKHSDMVGYTTMMMGKCPVAKQIGYLGGWPTGVFLIAFGVGAAFNNESFYFYGLAAFLALATIIFHRKDLVKMDPNAMKGVALFGAALALAQHAS